MKISKYFGIAILAVGLLASARVALADDGDMGTGTCCSSGEQCNAGQACCKKKNVTACSPNVETQCVDAASECAY